MARVWLHPSHRGPVPLCERDEADVHIYNVSGLAIANYTIQPGETIKTHIPVAGVYIIRAANGRILKKIAIK